MVDSVNAFILGDISITKEDISEQMRIAVGTELCIMILSFLMSIVGFHQNNARLQEQ